MPSPMQPEIDKLKETFDALVLAAPPPKAKDQAAWTFALTLIAVVNAGTKT